MGCNCHKHYHLGHAARDTIKKDFAKKEIYESRLEQCRSCSNLLARMACSRCGCFVNVKARFRRAVCPDGLW